VEISDLKCLIVNPGQGFELDAFAAKVRESSSLALESAKDFTEASGLLAEGNVAGMVIFADSYDQNLGTLLQTYQLKIGCFPDFQMIVCQEPEPTFMMGVFEYGIELFCAPETLEQDLIDFTANISNTLSDAGSTASKCFHLNHAVKNANQSDINELEQGLSDEASYDALAAYSRGKALEAVGKFEEAVKTFESAGELNNLFRPAQSGKGEALLLKGDVDQAIEVFEKMEVSNSEHGDRKLMLANAWVEKGDLDKANKYMEEAKELSTQPTKLLESKILILLASKKAGEAIKLMDQLAEVGPHLASKLNALGVSYSKAGKVKVALMVYKKTHKIVRKELKYKVSLNAALACHRGGDFETALKYLGRCEKEYGGSFAKLEKIKAAVEVANTRDKTG